MRCSYPRRRERSTVCTSLTSHTYHLVYDDRWRNIATYRGSDSDPKERMVYDNAGMMGYGGASYIDSIVLRDKDANTAWDASSDGTLEERLYLLQNWRSDVVFALEATGSGNGKQVENVRYEAYGIPTALPAGDTDRDGDTDATDVTQIDTWISGTTWAARGDLDLDNDVDAADKTLAMGMSSANGGRHILSDRGNRKGYAGYEWDEFAVHASWQVRNRLLNSTIGRWTERGFLAFPVHANAYAYLSVASLALLDAPPFNIRPRPGEVHPPRSTDCHRACYERHGPGAALANCLLDCRKQDTPPIMDACCQAACERHGTAGVMTCCQGTIISCVCWNHPGPPTPPHDPNLPPPSPDWLSQWRQCVAQQEDCIAITVPASCNGVPDGADPVISPHCEQDAWDRKCECLAGARSCVSSIVCPSGDLHCLAWKAHEMERLRLQRIEFGCAP